jgi:hypothetical protein
MSFAEHLSVSHEPPAAIKSGKAQHFHKRGRISGNGVPRTLFCLLELPQGRDRSGGPAAVVRLSPTASRTAFVGHQLFPAVTPFPGIPRQAAPIIFLIFEQQVTYFVRGYFLLWHTTCNTRSRQCTGSLTGCFDRPVPFTKTIREQDNGKHRDQ